MASKKKVFIIAGHGEGDPGACSIWGHEADYTRELATLVQEALKDKLTVVMYDQNKNCYAQSKRGNTPDYAAYDFTLEVHFNAKAKKDPYGDGRFTGIGGYIHPSNTGRGIARAVIDKVVALGFKEWLLADSTGLLNLNRAQAAGAKYFLIETAFIDDGDDMKWYTAHKADTAQAIAQGILEGLGLKSKAAMPADPRSESYYRVRTSWEDAKSQKFAGTQENAVKLARTLPGYSVFDPEGKCIYTNDAAIAPGLQASELKGIGEAGFVERMGKLYAKDEVDSGILACVSMAQGILESGYGQTDLAQGANNLHGMKCSLSGNTWSGTSWDGKSKYTKKTQEQHADGSYETITADFRKYPCIEDSIADHSAYLLGAKNGSKLRYDGLKGCTDYKKAMQIIKDGGYATSLTYVEKLCSIIEKWKLTDYDVKDFGSGSGEVIRWYRVRKTWADSKTQKGAYKILDNAKKCADQNPGYKVFDADGKVVYEPKTEEAVKVPFLVKVSISDLNIRRGPGTDYGRVQFCPVGVYTIVEVKSGTGSSAGWGRLKSGIGWISLDFVRRI